MGGANGGLSQEDTLVLNMHIREIAKHLEESAVCILVCLAVVPLLVIYDQEYILILQRKLVIIFYYSLYFI